MGKVPALEALIVGVKLEHGLLEDQLIDANVAREQRDELNGNIQAIHGDERLTAHTRGRRQAHFAH